MEVELKILNDKLDKILALLESNFSNSSFIDREQSEEIGILMGALANAQGSYKKLIPNEEYAGGKYANLDAILLATREALSKNKIAFLQRKRLLDEGSGAALLRTYLCHESGQFTSTTTRVFSGKTDRATGNTQEIHKRLEAMMILGIAPSEGDPIAFDDNGGEQEENQIVESIKAGEASRAKVADPNSVITKAQYNELVIALGNYDEIAENIMKLYKIETLADLPREVYHDALAKIRRIRKTAEDYENRKK